MPVVKILETRLNSRLVSSCWLFKRTFFLRQRLTSFLNYRTRAIISRGLYTFLPHFQRPFMYCDLRSYVWLVFKSGLWWRAYGRYYLFAMQAQRLEASSALFFYKIYNKTNTCSYMTFTRVWNFFQCVSKCNFQWWQVENVAISRYRIYPNYLPKN